MRLMYLAITFIAVAGVVFTFLVALERMIGRPLEAAHVRRRSRFRSGSSPDKIITCTSIEPHHRMRCSSMPQSLR